VTDTRSRELTSSDEAAHRVWTLVLVSLGLFMAALDTLVVTTALPVLRVSLHTSLSDLEWTVNAYNLAFACSLLTGAALVGWSVIHVTPKIRRERLETRAGRSHFEDLRAAGAIL
jgi:MFS family permease